MRISDWSSDVCSSDLPFAVRAAARGLAGLGILPPSRRSRGGVAEALVLGDPGGAADPSAARRPHRLRYPAAVAAAAATGDVVERVHHRPARSEERREGKECSVRVDLGGRRHIKKKTIKILQ